MLSCCFQTCFDKSVPLSATDESSMNHHNQTRNSDNNLVITANSIVHIKRCGGFPNWS